MANFEGAIGTPDGRFNLKVEYSISQSIDGNYSDVTAIGYVKRNVSNVYPYNDSSYSRLIINGAMQEYTGGYDLRSDGYKEIQRNTVRVYHNADGTKTINIYLTFDGQLSSNYPSGSINQDITLPTIPRQATITSAPNFNDEANPTIKYSNPAGNSVSSLQACISLNGSRADISYRDISKTGSSYTFNLTTAERNVLRNATPNSNSLSVMFYVRTVIGSSTYYSSLTKTMTIVNGNPTFSSFNFEDTNSITIALTGNNQNVIKGYSNVKATIPTTYKATANKGASLSKYVFNCGSTSKNITYSSSSSVNSTISNVSAGVFNVYATDSRSNSTLVTKNANETIDYNPLTKGNISVTRSNGVSETTTLTFNGKAHLVNFGTVTNSIKSAKYRYKATDSSAWTSYTDITLTIDSNGNFSFSSNIQGDTSSGFDINNSYNFEVVVTDELSNIAFTANLNSGVPNLALYKTGVGIMGKYNTSVGGYGQVAGNPLAYYPVGAIYLSVNSTSPATLFGGTWEQIKDRFLLACGSTYSNGATGGAATHTLTVNEMPSHSHKLSKPVLIYDSGGINSSTSGVWVYKGDLSTSNTGGGKAHNNMPPYLVVYMWKRTA